MKMKKTFNIYNSFASQKSCLNLILQLFKTCNNDCDFCFQKSYSDSIITVKQFVQQYSKSKSIIQSVLDKHYKNASKITIDMMGGELFCYDVNEQLYDIIDLLISYGAVINILTNLMTPHTDRLVRVIEFLEQRNYKNYTIVGSYDFGPSRFKTPAKFELFSNNCDKIAKVLQKYDKKLSFNIILTKYVLDVLRGEGYPEQLALFHRFIETGCDILFEHLDGNHPFALTYDQSVSLMKLLATDYGDLVDVQNLFNTKRNCLLTRRVLIAGHNVYYGCLAYHAQLVETDLKWKTDMINKYIQKLGCVDCEFVDNCLMHCPATYPYDKCNIKPVQYYIQDLKAKHAK